jgi:hypothetical protein
MHWACFALSVAIFVHAGMAKGFPLQSKDFHCNRARSIVLQFKTSKNTKKNIVSAMKEAVCVAFYFNRGIHCLVVEYQTME